MSLLADAALVSLGISFYLMLQGKDKNARINSEAPHVWRKPKRRSKSAWGLRSEIAAG